MSTFTNISTALSGLVLGAGILLATGEAQPVASPLDPEEILPPVGTFVPHRACIGVQCISTALNMACAQYVVHTEVEGEPTVVQFCIDKPL